MRWESFFGRIILCRMALWFRSIRTGQRQAIAPE